MENFYIYVHFYNNKEIKKNDIIFSDNKIEKPECIYLYKINNNNTYIYHIIFKIAKLLKRKRKYFEFEINDCNYKISFEGKGKTFIFDSNLEIKKKNIYFYREINQSNIGYDKKLEYFINALEQNGEKDIINELYKEEIDSYSKEKNYSFLITLFIGIYQNKDLCSLLLNNFKNINLNKKYKKDMDRNNDLEKYKLKIIEIWSKAKQLIEDNNYDIIDFYGIILCYLNVYDYQNYLLIEESLYKEKPETLYEILLIYNINFMNPINKNIDFFYYFCNYTIVKKELSLFDTALNYIQDLEIFVEVLEKCKEIIYNKIVSGDSGNVCEYIVKVNNNIKLKNLKEEKGSEKCKNKFGLKLIENIKEIINFSFQKNLFFVYFTNDFWKSILYCFKEPKKNNIMICFQLREIFLNYHQLVIKLFHREKFHIKEEAIYYFNIDEFAFLLDEMIKRNIIQNRNFLSNIQKLSLISNYNPYFIETKYIYRIDLNFLNLFDLNNIDNEFIETFRNMDFEVKFKDNINEYIEKLLSKIKKVSDFNIMQLINIEQIENKKKFFYYLNNKYQYIIINEINSLTGTKLNEAIKVLANSVLINYIYEIKTNKFDFIKIRIEKLSKDIRLLIYIEIIKILIIKEINKKIYSITYLENNTLKRIKNLNSEKDRIHKKDSKFDLYFNINKEIENGIDNENSYDFKGLKEFIIHYIINNIKNKNDIDNIINLINFYDANIKNEIERKEKIIEQFLEKILEKNSFSKEEFFSRNKNINIELLYELYEKVHIKNYNLKQMKNIILTLSDIKRDLDGNIKLKTLQEFLSNDESIIIKRLSLIKIILENYNSENELALLKKKINDINNIIKKIIYIRNNIMIYYSNTYKDFLKKLSNSTKNNSSIKEYISGEIYETIKEYSNFESLANKIDRIKHSLLFNVIYETKLKLNEEYKFNSAYKEFEEFGRLIKEKNKVNEIYEKYKIIIDKVQEIINNDEEKLQKFMNNFIQFFNITDDNLIDDITILFKSRKYRNDLKNMFNFFNYFEIDNKYYNNKNLFSKEKTFNIQLIGKAGYEKSTFINYILNEKNILVSSIEFNEIKKELKILKKNNIYNYENAGYFNKLFNSLSNKKEAFDFLLSKDFSKLKEYIPLNNRMISLQDLLDAENCKNYIIKMKSFQDDNKLLFYIKSLSKETIDKFVRYSKKYYSIIEFFRNTENTEGIYQQIFKIINEASFKIEQDSEKFLYFSEEQYELISFEELVNLKNKIHLFKENEFQYGNNNNNLLKFKILLFYKNVIINLEKIMDHMKVLREKGINLPIKISMKIEVKNNEPSIKYYLEEKEETFGNINNYLINVKNSYTSQISSFYIKTKNLRFLYGKQFRTIMKHLEDGLGLSSFLRYILNITDNNINITEEFVQIEKNSSNYKYNYKAYFQKSFESINNYIESLLNNNNITLEEHYNRMKIKYNPDRGIYLYECKDISKEEFIIYLFLHKIQELPIAQNILFINQETSIDELNAFLIRAFLCQYQTLFVIIIYNSFSEYQQNIIYSYIEQQLLYKKEKFFLEKKEINNEKDNYNYISSYIAFIYDKENNKVSSFLKKIKKFNFQIIKIKKEDIIIDKNSLDFQLENVKIITSDICGLGKSEKIKKLIKDNKQNYLYFSLGSILSKSIISEKLIKLLKEIRNENYKNFCFHLDLSETNEKEILNEFLFSFLITKFYCNNENIIYIPKDISIYVEIPNCFEDYLSQFGIFNVFNRENITFENMPRFNFSNEVLETFNRILGINSNEKLREFIEEHIGKRFSYYQIVIYIKLFFSEFAKIKGKLIIYEGRENKTEIFIQEFSKFTTYFTKSAFTKLLMEEYNYNRKDYDEILSKIYNDDLHNMKFDYPFFFINEGKRCFEKLFFSDKNSKEYKSSKDYLKQLKNILEIPNEIERDKGELKSLISILEEKDFSYVITNDNFKKMILLLYRINANIPVILMGETGCGKTALITKLNQLLNNGETTVHKIIIHPRINDENLCIIMKEKNEIAKKLNNKNLWIFFDEVNACSSLSLIEEIFINRTYKGINLNDNIRLIGACNPYRKIKNEEEKNELNLCCGGNDSKLIYHVEKLPLSLLYYVFTFGIINIEDEKEYIFHIIEKLFNKEEKYLHIITTKIISKCHNFIRKIYDFSLISLRDISRFVKLFKFFEDYFTKKNKCEKRINNEKNNKLRSIICSIYLCYYIKFEGDFQKTAQLDIELQKELLLLINNGEIEEEKYLNFIELIKNKDLKEEIIRNDEIINNLGDFIKIEQNYLMNHIEVYKGIGENQWLKENIFLLFATIMANIPLILLGNPGIGKKLSLQLIVKSMKGKYSNNKFFRKFPRIITTYLQGLASINSEDIENLFKITSRKLEYYKDENVKSLILFDELGLVEREENNKLNILNTKFEYIEGQDRISFVGISNITFNLAKLNRALILSIPNLDLDNLIETSKSIVESILPEKKDDIIFKILSHTYNDYKNKLKVIKELVLLKRYMRNKKENSLYNEDLSSEFTSSLSYEIEEIDIKNTKEFKDLMKKDNKIRIDFHGYRDFYFLIKGIAYDFSKLDGFNDDDIVQKIIMRHIERNFGGITYEIDIDFNSNIYESEEYNKLTKFFYEYYELKHENKIIKLDSILFFKTLYNMQCDNFETVRNLKIEKSKLMNYNLIKCINDNIRDTNGRCLLLQIKSSLKNILYEIIKLMNPFLEIFFYYESPFIDDNNIEYKFKKTNEIIDNWKNGKLIMIENMNLIQPLLYDLYNMNNEMHVDGKYAEIYFDTFNEQVNERFKNIFFVDEKFMNNAEIPLLNKFEKYQISFDKILKEELNIICKKLKNKMDLKNLLKKYDKMNYELKDILINCKNEEIQKLVYYYSIKLKEPTNEKKINEELLIEIMLNKITNIFPQDIIAILPDNNIIKKKYLSKRFYSFKDYEEEIKKYKISIIYTFSDIINIIDGINNPNSIMISEIRSENHFNNLIEEIKKKNEVNEIKNLDYIIIHFEQSDSKKLEFICNYILKYFKLDKHKYIILMHIHRNFKKNKNKGIYSIPNISPEINQIFIDNLNGCKKIAFKDLMTTDISTIFEEYYEYLELDYEFIKTLNIFLKQKLIKYGLNIKNQEDYLNNIETFMNGKSSIKKKIIEIVYKFIERKENQNFKDIIEEIYFNNIINKYSIDISSCFFDYIKEEIFNKYLRIIFEYLEDNNILTTINEIEEGHYQFLSEVIVDDIIKLYLDEINLEKVHIYKCKFLPNYNIPGFYNFFMKISNYITNTIFPKFIENEKQLRESLIINNEKINEFHIKEENLLIDVYNEIYNYDQFILKIINFIPDELIINDYITFYLQKYRNKDDIYNNDDIYHKIIELLLKLRFNQENKIIQSDKTINILIIKMIWLESNINYILNILKIIDYAKLIFDNNDNILYIKMKQLIYGGKIKYINNERRNLEHTKEINECYFLLLASICLCITDEIQITKNHNNEKNYSNQIQIELNKYYYILKNINIFLLELKDELFIFSSEMYIIDELIKIIEIFKSTNNIHKINKIKNYLIENYYIILKYSNNDDIIRLAGELINNFEIIYKLINEEEAKLDNDYRDKLGYILSEEIKKISDINYRNYILNQLLNRKKMINISIDVLETVLNIGSSYTNFSNIWKTLLNKYNIIIQNLENNLQDNFILEETLLFLFEKLSLKYFEQILNIKEKNIYQEEPNEIFKNCIKSLNKCANNSSKPRRLKTLFSLSYIKIFCVIFIKMFNVDTPIMNKQLEIIDIINGNDSICKMIRLYIYKILYNKYSIFVFYNEPSLNKYKLKEYIDFPDLIKNKDLMDIYLKDFNIKTLNNEFYEDSFNIIKDFQTKHLEDKTYKNYFNLGEFGIDNFYIASINIVLSNFLTEEDLLINKNFYYDICQPLFLEDKLVSKAIELFYNPQKMHNFIKLLNIELNNIGMMINAYRFCLNELYYKNKKGIYYSLYNNDDSFIDKNYYPGNDSKYNLIYYNIVNHFETKLNEGCYVCICEKGYYHSVPSGFPEKFELNLVCPNCLKEIGSYNEGKNIKIVKRENYFRIFKNIKEIKQLKKDKIKSIKLNEINYITLDEFKNKYIDKNEREKGIYVTDKDTFQIENKIVRNLSIVSYRLLNYILYIHLFFARLITDKEYFDKYLPKEMSWMETLNECWTILKNELLKINIYSIEAFMQFIFTDLFLSLNSKEIISNYEDLIKFEDYLESKIQKMIKIFQEKEYNSIDIKNNNNKNSFIDLLQEKNTYEYFELEKYPFYQYFSNIDYLNEEYLITKFSYLDKNKYPILKEYLYFISNKRKNEDKNDDLLKNFNSFNTALNIMNQKYYNNISRQKAEKIKLKDVQIYWNNKIIIDEFINFFNNFNIENTIKEKLSYDNPLSDFFIDNSNKFGKIYTLIYKTFINQQNEKLEKLLNLKIKEGKFDINCKNKINVHLIKKNEIFNLKSSKLTSFTDIIYKSSYRKKSDNYPINCKLYNDYVINYDLIEDIMTDLLLKNKKLLNETINEFFYVNEIFTNNINDSITIFKNKYQISKISLDDKVEIYKFYKDFESNIYFHKKIIKDFLELIKFLNKENNIDKTTKIIEINELNDITSDIFRKIFENNERFTVDKIFEIFDYYLKIIFENAIGEIENYQKELRFEEMNRIENYFSKISFINKKNLSHSIRLFITLVLFLEEDKMNKIQNNYNNIINYLNYSDFWEQNIYDNEEFFSNLNELKILNIKINQIIPFYKALGNDMEDYYFNDVKQRIEVKEEKTQIEKKRILMRKKPLKNLMKMNSIL